ncbi:MAG: hypothetical protein MUO51_09455 [Woeseiaceae bacterium]|nr:hypothetical protein [Woeseiaceae bacterium]
MAILGKKYVISVIVLTALLVIVFSYSSNRSKSTPLVISGIAEKSTAAPELLDEQRPISQSNPQSSFASRYASNAELAKAHYYLNESGEVVLPTNIELKFSKNFTFSDGEVIQLRYSVEKPFKSEVSTELDDGKRPDFFSQLQRAALDGNDHAGVFAYQEVLRCQTLNRSSPEKSAGQRCSQVTSETFDEAESLLQEIADTGSPVAQELYARQLVNSDPSAARKVFSSLWEAGFMSGLGGLRETAPPNSAQDYEQQIESEALSYASFVVTMAYLDGIPSDVVKEHAKSIFENEEQNLRSFSPQMHQDIESRARDLLLANRSCCRTFISN